MLRDFDKCAQVQENWGAPLPPQNVEAELSDQCFARCNNWSNICRSHRGGDSCQTFALSLVSTD